jgi:hypothetical protein
LQEVWLHVQNGCIYQSQHVSGARITPPGLTMPIQRTSR